MARLSHLDHAIVPEAKIVRYLLSHSHSGGRAKAQFLEGFGFRAKGWHILRDAIIAHATANDITALHQTPSASDMRSTARCRRQTVVTRSFVWYGLWCHRKLPRAW
ncbi:hypothetical protein ACVWYH_004226 [Bradyrhizobium sp. GM24.11]